MAASAALIRRLEAICGAEQVLTHEHDRRLLAADPKNLDATAALTQPV